MMKYLRLLPVAAATMLATFGVQNAQAQSSITISGTQYKLCGQENDNCTFSGTGSVVFGAVPPNAPSSMLTSPRTFSNGVGCYVGAVSQSDPAYGYGKSCWVSLAAASTPPATSTPAPSKPATTPTAPATTTPVTSTPTPTAPATTTPSTPATTPTTTPSTSTPTPTTSAITCGSPTQTAGGSGSGLISADTPTTDGLRIFQNNVPFKLAITTNSPAADTVVWSVADSNGSIKTQGSFPVKSGAQTNSISCTSTWSGYGALTATLQSHGGTLPSSGTRPMGIATFGVLPNLSSVLGTVTYAHQDQHRFGMQGFNGNIAALRALGISWTIDDRQVSAMEPNGPDTYTPSVNDLDPFYKTNPDQMRIVRLDGLPAWDSKTGQFNDSYYAPSNMPEFQRFMAKVGTDTSLIRAANYPNQQKNYYQVTWEPSLGWADSDANFVAMYKAAYEGIHSTDPNAVVMGTGNPFAANCDTCTTGYLKKFGALGLWNYIDAVSTHGYWNAGTFPAHPPELQDSDPDPANQANALDNQMTQLRAVMQAGKPNMKLFFTEAGVSYDPGLNYGPTVPSANQLFAHAAVGARAHIITLGGGAQVTTLFFGPDYPGEVGYGSFFDLNNAQGSFGATNLSPKPEAMAFATMTRALDGTNTLGRVNGTPSGTFAYAFQQLGNGKVVTAAWTHSNAQWPATGGQYSQTYTSTYSLQVDNAGTSGNVTKIDGYGNVSTVPYTNGKATLTLTEVPQYIVSNNATVAKANSTVPVGYTGQ
ncbi:hypothetical protein AX768_21890 [Burkholderia sp. PAMC 28687]|uniref:hypothetical protein n=1 Tax=Burkholderia sp. PAMC 28687 TaxID=1795874 RepID=UPI000780AE93|nr:hypothetical protein [Burkholderia sp. PAMC 28687]AMM16728.1 hypothetical protein AX768_21890 [Burkholderia sp. PAMC 28687]